MDDARIIAACRTSADALLAYANRITGTCPALYGTERSDRAWGDLVVTHATVEEAEDPNRAILSVGTLQDQVRTYVGYLGERPSGLSEEQWVQYNRRRLAVVAPILVHCWSLLPRLEVTP